MNIPYESHNHDLMSAPLAREKLWLERTSSQPADAPRWPGTENASANRKWKVHTLARESKGEISPLRPVGPGTARGFWGRRQVHYSGESSEGNRFITAHDL